jgi:V/A-type H+-transporting ATPase subunit E
LKGVSALNGLQAIQDRILTEAQEKADQMMSQAQCQCAEILAAAIKEKDQIAALSSQSTATQYAAVLKRARSTAALENRRILLQARQSQIDQVLSRSVELLCQFSITEKKAFYQTLLQQTGAIAGEITLAAADQDLASLLFPNLGGQFTLAPAPGKFIGGFVLRRDLIEDNLTYERLFASSRPQLVRLAAAALAGQPIPALDAL